MYLMLVLPTALLVRAYGLFVIRAATWDQHRALRRVHGTSKDGQRGERIVHRAERLIAWTMDRVHELEVEPAAQR